MKRFKGLSLLLSVLLVLSLGTLAFSQEKGVIEIFSWWTAAVSYTHLDVYKRQEL